MERRGSGAAGAVPRAPVGGRRADRSRVPVHEGRQRLLGTPRPDVALAPRRRSRGHGHLPGAHRVPGAGGRGGRRAPRSGRGPRGRGARRLRCHGRAARHRRRPVAPLSQGARPLRRRRPEPGERWHRPAASDNPRSTRAARDRARRDHRRNRGARMDFTGSRPVPRSCPCASGAGSRTRRAATASTRGPTRSSPGSRPPSIPTTTAMPTTRPGSRSSAWSSRTPASRMGPSRAGSPGRRSSTC